MKTTLIAFALALGVGSVASPVVAANARHPYQNIDRRVDQGNPTGDNMVDQLNAQQLSNPGGLGSNPTGGPSQGGGGYGGPSGYGSSGSGMR